MTFGIGEFYSLSSAFIWAVAVILFKKSGESLNPFALNLFKNVLALTLLGLTIAVLAPHPPQLPMLALPTILVSGFLGIGVGDTLYLRALNAIGASRMAVSQTLYSPFVIALSAAFLGERLRDGQWLGVAFVLSGILLVTYVRNAGLSQVDTRLLRVGAAVGVLSVLLMAIGVVLAKPMLEQYDFLWVVWLRLVGGLLGMGGVIAWRWNALAIVAEYRRVRQWPLIVAASFTGTYLSMLVWLAGYKYTHASVAAVLNETATLFIVLLAVVFLHERVGPRQVTGIALALGGVLLVVAG